MIDAVFRMGYATYRHRDGVMPDAIPEIRLSQSTFFNETSGGTVSAKVQVRAQPHLHLPIKLDSVLIEGIHIQSNAMQTKLHESILQRPLHSFSAIAFARVLCINDRNPEIRDPVLVVKFAVLEIQKTYGCWGRLEEVFIRSRVLRPSI